MERRPKTGLWPPIRNPSRQNLRSPLSIGQQLDSGRAVMIKWQCWGRIVRPGHRLGLCSSREAFFFGFSSAIDNQLAREAL